MEASVTRCRVAPLQADKIKLGLRFHLKHVLKHRMHVFTMYERHTSLKALDLDTAWNRLITAIQKETLSPE